MISVSWNFSGGISLINQGESATAEQKERQKKVPRMAEIKSSVGLIMQFVANE